MRNTLIGMMLGVFCSTALAQDQSTPKPAASTAPATVAAANNQFALDLYAKLSAADAAKDKNLFFSPFSISTALSMTYAGARAETADEMAKTLGLMADEKPLGVEDVAAQYQKLLTQWNEAGKKNDYELRLANSLWAQKGYKFLPEYMTLVQKNFDATLDLVDFAGDTEAARTKINQWVEGKTNEKIKELFPAGILDHLTRLVLVNAVYFKGTWQAQFDKNATKPAPFTLADKTVKDVPTMNRTGGYSYAETANAQVLELPYKGRDLAMTVLLPKAAAPSFADWEKALSLSDIQTVLKDLKPRQVEVHLPKWTMTSEFKLKDTLSSMGMEKAFTSAADFSGMNGKKDLYIQAVVHKAFIDVNEAGSEAAAATGVAMGLKSAVATRPVAIPIFRADHPFIFLIRDTKSGAILFMGRVMNPAK